MAGAIKVLDEKVVSQIAAGEVIERPASVVKELLENSIDAQATEIRIEIEDGGKKSIRIVDNGAGMTREDAEKAFFRHSTSKINTLRDLESITSLGFRGEALASIAAISRVKLLTKPGRMDVDSDAATEIRIEGGKIKHVRDAACSQGTTIMVRDLFFNTPARRKYLRSARSEIARITDLVTRQALCYPEISFELIHNDTEIINAPKTEKPLDNIIYIYGKEVARNMLSVDHSDHDFTIGGFVSKPGVTKNYPTHISVFVNRRYITSRLLNSAIKDAYHNLIMKNRHPIAVLSLKIHPRKVDVNVHPTKQEIRFEDERKVSTPVKEAVEKSLKTSLIPQIDDVKLQTPGIGDFGSPQAESLQVPDEFIPAVPRIEASGQISIEKFHGERGSPEHPSEGGIRSDSPIPRMNLVGQILNTYIVAQSGDNILLIDQHAAHERILFETLMNSSEEEKSWKQELLTPLTLELTPRQRSFVNSSLDMFGSLGFEIEPFGGSTFQVRSVPVIMGQSADSKTVSDIIDELVSVGASRHGSEVREKAMAVVACHSAIRAGDELSLAQMRGLMESLYTTDNIYSCPHGRPSILSISKYELEKRFKRK